MKRGAPTADRAARPSAAYRLSRNSPLPPYQLVADELRQQIRSGRLRPGDRLPPSRVLQDRYKIANMTARSAVRLLRDEGLIHTTQGRGSFVTDRLPPDTEPQLMESAPIRMPTSEYTELSRRLDELSEVQAALLRILSQAGDLSPH